MSVALNDKLVCQHVLRILTGIKDLSVLEVRSQYRVSKITSHDAVLDILAEDSNRHLFDLEIQRADTIDHARRTSYPVGKYLGDIKMPYDDGQHILYVNAAVDDGSEAARLLQYFKTADPDDMSQGDLSKRVHFLKCEEGGYEIMCEVSEKIYAEGRAEGKTEGERIGEERINRLNAFLLQEKRYEDLERSIRDKAFQERLILQYDVKK